MKSNRFLPFILSGAMMLPIAALAQTGAAADNSANAATSQAPDKERGEKFAEKLNLTPEQKADLKSIRENAKQQAQAIKSDSSLTPDQKKAWKQMLGEEFKFEQPKGFGFGKKGTTDN